MHDQSCQRNQALKSYFIKKISISRLTNFFYSTDDNITLKLYQSTNIVQGRKLQFTKYYNNNNLYETDKASFVDICPSYNPFKRPASYYVTLDCLGPQFVGESIIEILVLKIKFYYFLD